MPLVTVADLSVAYDIAGNDAAPPLLLINGLGSDRSAWRLQVPVLADRYRTISYDNRDVGQTGAGETLKSYSIETFAADAAGLLNALGIKRAHIVGASMGGAIAQEFALAYPERVTSLTIVCSWAKTDPWLAELLGQWERLFASLGPLEWARTSLLRAVTHRFYDDPAQLSAVLEAAAASPFPQETASYIRQSQAAIGHDTRDRLPMTRVPTHIIAGAVDQLTPLRFSEEIAALIPDARLSVIEGIGHGMFWEATEEFNDLVLGFLADVPEGATERARSRQD